MSQGWRWRLQNAMGEFDSHPPCITRHGLVVKTVACHATVTSSILVDGTYWSIVRQVTTPV